MKNRLDRKLTKNVEKSRKMSKNRKIEKNTDPVPLTESEKLLGRSPDPIPNEWGWDWGLDDITESYITDPPLIDVETQKVKVRRRE